MSRLVSENAILAAWRATIADLGDAPGILAPTGEVLRTFREIDAEAAGWEMRLREFAPGSVVALQIGNSAAFPALMIALFRCALIPVPLGRHIEKSERAAALEVCRAKAVIELEGDVVKIARTCEERARGPLELPGTEFLKLTSGTTSQPRVVRFRASQLLADCEQICDTMGLGAADVNFGAIPFSHSYGFSNLITPLLCRGIPLVASDDRMPRAILGGLAASGATVFPGMPVFFEKLVQLADPPALPQLRLCISAGAPLGMALARSFAAKFGRKIHSFYGSSECGGIGYDASEEINVDEGFAGTPMRGVEVVPLADRRIAVRSAAVADGYFPESEPGVLGGGCFHPSDLITWSARGMTIVGRASDVINVAGRKLNPGEVEQRLLEYPGVRQAILFGVPSTLRGEEAIACVSGDGLDSGGVLRFCHERLSQWQIPRDVWIVPEIATTDRGKVNRRLLAEKYLETHPRPRLNGRA